MDAVNIHYHGGGPMFIPESPDELRINHHKKKMTEFSTCIIKGLVVELSLRILD